MRTRLLSDRSKTQRNTCPSRIRSGKSARCAPRDRKEAQFPDNEVATGIPSQRHLDQTHPVQGRNPVTAPFQGGRGPCCTNCAGPEQMPSHLRGVVLKNRQGRHHPCESAAFHEAVARTAVNSACKVHSGVRNARLNAHKPKPRSEFAPSGQSSDLERAQKRKLAPCRRP